MNPEPRTLHTRDMYGTDIIIGTTDRQVTLTIRFTPDEWSRVFLDPDTAGHIGYVLQTLAGAL